MRRYILLQYMHVGVIAPWNYPVLLATRSVATALALGKAVILKPAVQGGFLWWLLASRRSIAEACRSLEELQHSIMLFTNKSAASYVMKLEMRQE